MGFASLQDALGDRHSKMVNANAKKDSIGMEINVYSVLMDKSGTQLLEIACAQLVKDGMETSVKKLRFAQEEESTSKIWTNAYVSREAIGMELNAK